MIKVTVEILPRGYMECRRTIGLMQMANVFDLAPQSDYRVDFTEWANPIAGTKPQSAWSLIAGALAAAKDARSSTKIANGSAGRCVESLCPRQRLWQLCSSNLVSERFTCLDSALRAARLGGAVESRPRFDNIHLVQRPFASKLRNVSCRRYDRATDFFIDVDPGFLGIQEE